MATYSENTVWVTRDNGDCVRFWKKKSHFKAGNCPMDIMHIGFFKCIFGITPRKRSCNQYELTLRKV